jgi:hypothetical protein
MLNGDGVLGTYICSLKNSFVSLLKTLFISAGDTPFEATQVQIGELVGPEARFLCGHGCL